MTQYEYYTTLFRYLLEGFAALGSVFFLVGIVYLLAIFYPLLRK